MKISYVVVRVSHLFLEFHPLRINASLEDVDGRENILDSLRWLHKCLNLLNVLFPNIRHGDIQSFFGFSTLLIKISTRLGLSCSLCLPSTLNYSRSCSGCSDCSSCLISTWSSGFDGFDHLLCRNLVIAMTDCSCSLKSCSSLCLLFLLWTTHIDCSLS